MSAARSRDKVVSHDSLPVAEISVSAIHACPQLAREENELSSDLQTIRRAEVVCSRLDNADPRLSRFRRSLSVYGATTHLGPPVVIQVTMLYGYLLFPDMRHLSKM